ncbi:MAG TPA: 5'-nucleotidase C-terminal domain-containing protein [Polyangia bacterium]|nr:5'-nucleotidase C-terminal domain-containing protein [Polyangia bacterium]
MPALVVSTQLDGELASLDCEKQAPSSGLVELAAELAGEPQALALDTGDLLGASAVSRRAVEDDAPALARALRSTGLRAMALGYRDLAMPRETLITAARALKEEGLPLVLSNLRCAPAAAALCAAVADTDDPPLLLDTPAGPVAFVVLLAPSALVRVARDRAADLELLDPADTLRRLAPRARAAGAKAVVASYDAAERSGLDAALGLVTALDSSETMAPHDLLLVNRLREGVREVLTSQGLPMVATRPRHAVLLSSAGRERVRPARVAQPPAEVLHYTAALSRRLCQALHRPLPGGQLEAPLEREQFAGLLLDVMREAARAEVAILNHNALRAPGGLFPLQGRIDELAVTAALPFDDQLRVGRLPGALVGALARSPQAARLYLRGVQVQEGRVLVNGRPLDEQGSYRVVTTGFLAQGGDGVLPPNAMGSLVPLDRRGPRELLLDWLTRPHTGDITTLPVDPGLHPRWTLRWSLDATYSSTSISNPGGYTDAQLSRAASTALRGDLELRADADHPGFRFDNSLRLRYGVTRTRTATADSGFTESSDLIVQRSTLTQRVRPRRPRPYDPQPYFEGYTESEFTRPVERSYHHLEVRASVGLRFTLWGRFQVQGGGGLDWELLAPGSLPMPVVVAGWSLPPTRIFSIRGRPAEAQTTLDVAWRDPGHHSDLLVRFNAKLSLPLWGTLAVVLGYDLFVREVAGMPRGVAGDITIGLRVAQSRSIQSFGH